MMQWLVIHLVLFSLSLTKCLSTTSKTTPEPPTSPASNRTRDNDEQKLDINSLMDNCNSTFRTEMSYIESLNKSGSFPDETDITAKCFVRCILEKSMVVSEDGVIDPEEALVFFAAERAGRAAVEFRDSTTACSNRNETCMCERSYQFVKCVVELELNKYYIFKTVY